MDLIHCGFPECASFYYKNENRHWERNHKSRPPRKWRGERWKCPDCGKKTALSQPKRHVKKDQLSKAPLDSISMGSNSTPESALPHLATNNNATRLFVWTSGMDYTGIDQPSYFEDFTIPKPALGGHPVSSQCPFFAQNNF